MDITSRWWIRRCLHCQARKTSPHTIHWPTLSLPLPNGLGITVSVDYFGPLPLTPRGNVHILLFTDRFSRRADMFAVSAENFTATGTADILLNEYIPLWGCPVTLLSENNQQFTSKLATIVYDRVGIRKVDTSAYHPAPTAASSGSTMYWPRCSPWLATRSKPTEMCYCRTCRRPTTTLSTSPPDLRLTKSTSTAYPASRSRFSNPKTSAVTRAWIATTWFTSALPPTGNKRPATTCLLPRPRAPPTRHLASITPQRAHHGCPPRLTPFLRWRLGLDLQLRLHYPSECQEGHRRNHSEDEALVELERTFQDPRGRPDCRLRHPRQPPPTRQAALPRSTFRPSRTALQNKRLHQRMQTPPQPQRHQRHTQAPTGGPHNIRPHSFCC